MHKHFISLGRELDVVNPKAPEAVFKSHLEDRRNDDKALDSHKANLATTYANAFINAGFCTDTILLKDGENSEWMFNHKESGIMAASASLGLLLLWNIDEGFDKLDKYMESSSEYIRAGSYMAIGLVNSGIKNENDPVKLLLMDKFENATEYEKIGILMGWSFTYAGTEDADIIEQIVPLLLDLNNSIELVSIAAMVLGLLCIGTSNNDSLEAIISVLMT